LRQAFGTLPGMGDKVAKMAEEITKGGNVTLGMHLGIFVPGLAKILAQTGAQGLPALPPDDKPLVEVNLDLKELSSDKVADDVFTTPAGYKEAPIEDVVKGMTNALTGAKAAEPQPAELKPAALELRVEPKGTDFLLTWNKDCAVITNSIQGGLSITDGGRHVHYDMGPSQLKSGSIVYTPVASDVSFELEVTGADGSKTVRRIRTRTEPSPASPSK
jgi:hypothetical protein